ncbi:gamma carbonic anhydrase family protein (plasmid) [Tistrella bauzanensis]|uniref:Gamma carbonic anhydrase family protein n=1 Tax=Tistrella arctica TaxID=3133430 RepID=A0ABU9YP68_9PROT
MFSGADIAAARAAGLRIGAQVVVDPTARIDPSAAIFGKVTLKAGVSVWMNVVFRAEMFDIVIGENSNIQDFVMVHVGSHTGTHVGRNCSITHHVTIHGCQIGDNVLVGIGATVMDGCVIGENSIIAPQSCLKEGTIIPPNSIVVGTPAKVVRTRDNGAANRLNAFLYRRNAEAYAEGDDRLWSRDGFHAEMEAEIARIAREAAGA